LYVIVDEEQLNNIEEQDDLIAELKTRIEQQQNEIEYLRGELSSARQRTDQIIQQMQQDTESDKQRSDTIILQLTRQFEEQTKLLEDMRHRSMWSRVKTAFGFAVNGLL
jgi:predicted RNase H-like nuclease (RuvC/YqgF family)